VTPYREEAFSFPTPTQIRTQTIVPVTPKMREAITYVGEVIMKAKPGAIEMYVNITGTFTHAEQEKIAFIIRGEGFGATSYYEGRRILVQWRR
jgi:hypothetical protein